MSLLPSPHRRGFTLVEMLVVIGIIAVLAALLMPAVMAAVSRARNARIAVEIAELGKAVESYRNDTGDYPPNFRDFNVVMRHIRRAYPKITPAYLNDFIQRVWGGSYSSTSPPPATTVPNIDEGESLVFWLYLVDNDPRDPFKASRAGSMAQALVAAQSPKRYFPFKEDRLVSDDGDRFPSYRAIYSKETHYVYIDSRSYTYYVQNFSSPQYAAFAEQTSGTASWQTVVRPYWSEIPSGSSASAPPTWPLVKPMNTTTFQILCAGQDGDWGTLDNSGTQSSDAKLFPSGRNYNTGDRDNLTNFSDGFRLEDKIP